VRSQTAELSAPPREPSRIAKLNELSVNAETSKRISTFIQKFHLMRSRHVKALESRSQLLDAALASADEANRRWEECRALVDSLRAENNALRTALQEAQQQLSINGAAENAAPEANTDTKAND
jgi:hypothetical protein